MKKILVTALALLALGAGPSTGTLIPTEQLEQYFIDNGIEYTTVPDFYGQGGDDDYRFWSTRDPADGETIGVFFELYTGNSLSDTDMHWGVGLRGPRPGDPWPDHYGGRGLALGHLPFFDHCTDMGGFIEDFTANEQEGGELQLTYCQDEPLSNYRTYRIDVHVSKNNVWVGIWGKAYSPYGVYYWQIAEYSCVDDNGPGRSGWCPEDPGDAAFGGLFLGSGFLDLSYTWSATSIYVAFF